MTLPTLENLNLQKITKNVILVKQVKTPAYFSCCDGLLLLPTAGGNQKTIILDLNIEPQYIKKINKLFGPVSHYINSHGHMDHIAHVYTWEKLGATIHAPSPEGKNLLKLNNFYESFGFDTELSFSTIEKFGKLNGYKPCKSVEIFDPGETLDLDGLRIETIPLFGHSKSHHGFFIPEKKVLHISCLGFDKNSEKKDGFGPWYGFKECSIRQYFKDIEKSEKIYMKRAQILTSSHAYPVHHPDPEPFIYMRKKIKKNQAKIDKALQIYNIDLEKGDKKDNLERLLDLDLFFPKRKIDGFLKRIYRFWEYWIIENHLLEYYD